VTIGRGDATLVLSSRAVSRHHLRIFRREGDVLVEDLGTRNGTTLAGALLTRPIAVGAGVLLLLGGEVPCEIKPFAGEDTAPGDLVEVEIADMRYVLPLGELRAFGLRIHHEAVRDESFVVLRTPAGVARPYLGDYQLAERVELCAGDEIRSERGGPVRIRVPATYVAASSEEETMVHRTIFR
jgi:hypothetical protein